MVYLGQRLLSLTFSQGPHHPLSAFHASNFSSSGLRWTTDGLTGGVLRAGVHSRPEVVRQLPVRFTES